MGSTALWSLLATLTSLASLAAACVAVYWTRDSASSSLTKRIRGLETQLTDLSSSFDSLMESHRKLSARVGMRQLRERRKGEAADDEPVPPGDKAGLRRKYLNGRSHIEIARQVAGLPPGGDE